MKPRLIKKKLLELGKTMERLSSSYKKGAKLVREFASGGDVKQLTMSKVWDDLSDDLDRATGLQELVKAESERRRFGPRC